MSAIILKTKTNTNSKTTGNISEAKVLTRLVELGYPVLIPFGDNERYDLVIELSSNVFKRVQVKTARLTNDDAVLAIPLCSSQAHRGNGKQDYHGDVDFIMAYSPNTNKIYKLEIDDVDNREVFLRLQPAKNNGGRHSIRYATDYEL